MKSVKELVEQVVSGKDPRKVLGDSKVLTEAAGKPIDIAVGGNALERYGFVKINGKWAEYDDFEDMIDELGLSAGQTKFFDTVSSIVLTIDTSGNISKATWKR